MSENPFSARPASAGPVDKSRRERVKFTVYAILGSMVTFCLALLVQGCRHHQPAAENPFAAPQQHAVSQR